MAPRGASQSELIGKPGQFGPSGQPACVPSPPPGPQAVQLASLALPRRHLLRCEKYTPSRRKREPSSSASTEPVLIVEAREVHNTPRRCNTISMTAITIRA